MRVAISVPALLAVASTLLGAAGASPAGAQDYDRPGIVRGLCAPDGCDEFQILGRDRIAGGPDGELFRTRVATFHASRGGRRPRNDENGFVYCSRTRPALINAPRGGAPVAVMLAPDERSPAYAQRGTANFMALYFGLCHGLEAGRAAARDRRGVAASLGYRVALDGPRTVNLRRVEDILTP